MSIEKIIAETFLEMANGLETGSFGKRPKIALVGNDSEHGEENLLEAVRLATARGVDVEFIGSEDAHGQMECRINSGDLDGAVTMHYPFPIGVSTVGRVVTPARGREMFIATTTGTSSGERVEGMVLNTIYGIITAKACGIAEPTVGILNLDGARQCELVLKQLQDNGYGLKFAESARSDGGAVLRGNDVLQGTPDVLVTDPLTGNVLIKLLSAYSTGGSYEATGSGYGPGIGKNYEKLVLIISRASGAPLIANALEYAAQLVSGGVFEIARQEFEKAEKAGLTKLLAERKETARPVEEEVKMPPKEPVTADIAGIEVMDLEDAAKALWKAGIYAETGMGCTGPLVMMSAANKERAEQILREKKFI